MARLESNLKMGYYPTPEHTLSFILSWIAFQRPAGPKGSHTLDPCCGTGETLQQFHFRNSHVTTYGVELDAQRAIEAREKLRFAVQGSIFDARINPLGSLGLLYLNPPYDWDEGERVEMRFLKHAHKWLCTDGVLVFLVPELIFHYEKHMSWIGQHFYDIRIVRVTKADYPAFKQVVLFGKKRKERYETGTVGSPPYPHIEDVEASSYAVPLTSGPSVLQGTNTVTDEEVAGHWPHVVREIESICRKCDTTTQLSPLLPLRKGHLTSLLTAGILDGKVETVDGPMILKGFSDRAKSTYYEDDKEITHDTFSVGIRVIEPRKGVWYDIK
jgi:predicted RNA methylase